MKRYAVKEQGNDIFITKNLNMAIHEMISIIFARLKSIYQNGYCVNNIDIDDVYIEEFVPHKGKRFRYVTNKYYFDKNNLQYVKSTKKLKQKRIKHCDEMINEMDVMYLKKSPKLKNQNINNIYSNKDNKQKSKIGDILLDSANIINKTITSLDNNINTNPFIEVIEDKSKIDDNIKIKDEDDIECDISNISELISEPDESEIDSKLNEISNQIADLQKIKEHGEKKLNDLRKIQEQQMTDLIDYSADVNYVKKKLYIEKEKEEERRKKFNADKKAYFLIKEDINNGKLKIENILENPMFKDKYPVFEYMESKNILIKQEEDLDGSSINDDYFVYLELTKDKNCNNSYLSEEEQKRFSEYLEKNKDIIDEFLNKKNKIKPLNEILKELNYDDDIPDISVVENTNVNLQENLYDYDKLQETVNRMKQNL